MPNKYPILLLIPLLVTCVSAVPNMTGEELFEIGNEYYANASINEAIDMWIQAKALDPTLSANAWYNIGLAYAGMKEYEKAIMAWNETIMLVPNSSRAYDNMGTAYAILGKYKEAELAYDIAIAIDPDVVKYRIDKELLTKGEKKEETPLIFPIVILALFCAAGMILLIRRNR